MDNELLKIATSQGIWATLSVVLILYILKTQEKRDVKQDDREKNYQEIISKLTDKFNIVEDVKKDVEDIKDYVFKKKIWEEFFNKDLCPLWIKEVKEYNGSQLLSKHFLKEYSSKNLKTSPFPIYIS